MPPLLALGATAIAGSAAAAAASKKVKPGVVLIFNVKSALCREKN